MNDAGIQVDAPTRPMRNRAGVVVNRRAWVWIALALLCGVGGYLRIDSLGYNDLNRDEYGQTVPVVRDMIATGQVFGRSAGTEWWDRLLPFFSFAMSAAAVASLGDTDFALRLFPALFGTVSILLFFGLARRFLAPVSAVLSTTLFTFSTAHIYYSREARYYAYIVFFALVVLLLALRIADKHAPRRGWAAIGLVAAAVGAISTHWFSVLFLGGTIAFLICNRVLAWAVTPGRRRLLIWPAFAVVVLCVALFAFSFNRERGRSSNDSYAAARSAPDRSESVIEFIAFLPQVAWDKWRDVTGAHGGWSARFSSKSKGYRLLGLTVRTFANAGDPYHPSKALYFNRWSPVLAWGMTTLAAIGWLTSFRRRPHFAWMTTLWFVPAILLFWLANPEHFVAAKYIIFVLPLFVVAASLGVDWILGCFASCQKRESEPKQSVFFVGHGIFVAAVVCLSWNAVHAARFHQYGGYNRLAKRILTEMPPDVVLCNLSNLPLDTPWDYVGFYDGDTETLLRRYLNGDGEGNHQIHQIAGFDGWCEFVRSRPSARYLVFGVDRSSRKDPRLVRWIRDHALPDTNLTHTVQLEPFLIPSPDVDWPRDPAQIALAESGRSNDGPMGAWVRATTPMSITPRFVAAGTYEWTTVATAKSKLVSAALELTVDGETVAREVLPAGMNQQRLQGRFTIDKAGEHMVGIAIVARDGSESVGIWLDYLAIRFLDSPRKYGMSDPGVAALLIDAQDGSHQTWALPVEPATRYVEAWIRFHDAVRALPVGSPVVLVSRGQARHLFDVDQAPILPAFETIGAGEDILGRLRAKNGLLMTGVVGGGPGSARVEPLKEWAVRFFDKGYQLATDAAPFPWTLAVANTSGATPVREFGAGSYHLPRTYLPGVFYIPTAEMTATDGDMESSYFESGVATDARIRSRFVWDHRQRILDRCLDSNASDSGVKTVWSMPESGFGEAVTAFDHPARRWMVEGRRWKPLIKAPVSLLREDDYLRLVMTNNATDKVAAVHFILRSSRDDGIWWLPVAIDPEQTTPFECDLRKFKAVGGTKLSEIESVELRVRPRGNDPVTIDVFDARILRRPDSTSAE